jgi:hypothetical protein
MDAIERGLVRDRATERWLRPALAVLAVSQVAAGVWEAVAPSSFFKLARIGAYNEHFIRDLASLYIAYGATLLIAVRRPSWRVPVLALGTIQYGLHFVSHIIDVGKGHPGWVGPVNAALVGVGLLAFAGLLAACIRRQRT